VAPRGHCSCSPLSVQRGLASLVLCDLHGHLLLAGPFQKAFFGLGNVHLCAGRSGRMHDAVSSCLQGMPALQPAGTASEARTLMIPGISTRTTEQYTAKLFAQQVDCRKTPASRVSQQRPKHSAPVLAILLLDHFSKGSKRKRTVPRFPCFLFSAVQGSLGLCTSTGFVVFLHETAVGKGNTTTDLFLAAL